MLRIGDKEYRNLQEQVLKNQDDIEVLKQGNNIAELGIKIINAEDPLENATQLPDPNTYSGDYGDGYLVGAASPFNLYVYSRSSDPSVKGYWFPWGLLNAPSIVPGPTGPTGPAGPQGTRGSFWYTQSGAPTNTVGVNENDQSLDGSTGNVYQFTNGAWGLVGNIRGPQGIQGIQGIIGPTGPIGPAGPQGEKGDQGQFVTILGEVENTEQLPMIDTVPRYAAYLIPDTSGAQHVWLIIGEGTTANPYLWHDAGILGAIEETPGIISITYTELTGTIANNALTPGKWYRIIDYVTTTAQAESQSAGHGFDILVLATSTNQLSETARACLHEGDTYFVNSKLDAWQLKYCVTNDTNRFAWASSAGKGVIYELIDEFDNKCGYDFKNIQFKRYKITVFTKCPDLVNGYYGARIVGSTALIPSGATISTSDTVWRFTFDLNGADVSLRGSTSLNSTVDTLGCYGNEIFPYYRTAGSYKLVRYLNNVVFLNTNTSLQCFRNRLTGARIYSNTFGNYCYSNTFGNYCYSNTFGNNCNSNTFGNYCNLNTFGNNCNLNTFGNYCNSNTFGNYCNSNTFGNYCYSNTFGNNCNSNTFGNYCYSNTFGNYCYSNTFGNYCYSNTFGNNCYSNTFGNYCNSITPVAFRAEWGETEEYATLYASNNTGYTVTLAGTIAGTAINQTIPTGSEQMIGTVDQWENPVEGTLTYTIRDKQITNDIYEEL